MPELQAQDDNTIIDKYISLGLSGSDTKKKISFVNRTHLKS